MAEGLRIVFFGTPDFAVSSLAALHESPHRIVGVVTRPDRPKGRGRKIQPTPVKEAAERLGYDVLQPESVKDRAFLDQLERFQSDIFVVTAFGRLLPENLLSMPRIASLNVHASLLPKFRGASPIQRVIMEREAETGVTIMLMDTGMDTGDIVSSAGTPISRDDDAQTLHDRLAVLGGELLINTLDEIQQNGLHAVSQDDSQATYAPPLTKADGHIDWNRSAEDVDAFIRGVTPWPGAFTYFENDRLIILKAVASTHEPPSGTKPGTVVEGFTEDLHVAAGTGVLTILEIKGRSGKHLSARDFLLGYRLAPGTVLT